MITKVWKITKFQFIFTLIYDEVVDREEVSSSIINSSIVRTRGELKCSVKTKKEKERKGKHFYQSRKCLSPGWRVSIMEVQV